MSNRLTKEQAAIIGAYTGISCGPFSDIQLFGSKVLGRSTYTHEYGNPDFVEALKTAAKPFFLKICSKETDVD